jgi:hypothetical protein
MEVLTMKCFYHPEVDAVGICKNCQKGLCVNCALDVGDGLACNGSCAEKVIAVNRLVARNVTAHQQAPRSYLMVVVMFGVLGILVLSIGLVNINQSARLNLNANISDYFMAIAGVIFLGITAYYYSLGRKLTTRQKG